jgi:sulfite reductase (ferredoxin)
MFYDLPATLPAEIDELESLIEKHRRGELDAAALKPRRVPFGCYEQRRDGSFMVRIRATGGAITPHQLSKIAFLSSRFGGAFVHITTRQEFQIHEVALENVIPIMRELLSVGLSTRGGGGNTVRNILVSPEAGLDEHEVFDPSLYAFALTTRLIAEPDSWNMPRKLKLAFSNSVTDTAFAQFNDIGFIASIQSDVKGFKVYIAGGMGNKPAVGHLLYDFVPADQVYLVAEAVKHLFDQYGNRKNRNAARLRFLWNELGEARFFELYRKEFDAVARQNPPKLVPYFAPRAEAALSLEPIKDESQAFITWKNRYCAEQPQKGLFSILVPVSLGNIKNEELLALADLLKAFGDNSVRATFAQNLRLRNIPEAYLGNIYAVAKNISKLADAPRLLSSCISCTGANTCKLGICLPKGALIAIEKTLKSSGLDLDLIEDFRIHLSGCPNTCGQHMTADLGFYGQAKRQGQRMYPAYGIVAGSTHADGQARLALPIDQIDAHDLPNFVVDVLRQWIDRKQHFASFAEYIDAEGTNEIRTICDKYRDIPEFDEDKNYYFDWGADEAFSLVGRGVGECSSGLFDLIDLDRKLIEEQRRKLEEDILQQERTDSLYRIVLSSARMLLVTRGIEASSDTEVYKSFLQHFIKAGLVDLIHQQIVETALAQNSTALLEHSSEVLQLAEAVEKLYKGMDNSLRFPAEKTKAVAVPEAASISAERDYRGVACPMNFVKVKLDLSKMKVGERLRVLLDDGQPIENVPRSVAQEGHKVLSQTRSGDAWTVVIEKK